MNHKNETVKENEGKSPLAIVLLVLAIVSGVIGFMGVENAMVDGLGKAFFGVFICFYFIVLFFGNEK